MDKQERCFYIKFTRSQKTNLKCKLQNYRQLQKSCFIKARQEKKGTQ